VTAEEAVSYCGRCGYPHAGARVSCLPKWIRVTGTEPEPCPHARKTIESVRIGEGIYRRLHRTQRCLDCGEVLGLL